MRQDTIHVEITYNVPAHKVWAALTDKERIREWFFDVSNFEVKPDVEFEFSKPGFKREFLHRCRILDVKEKEILQYTWAYPGLMDGESVVTWELIPRGNVTSLRLTHEGLSVHQSGGESFTMGRFESGWGDILGKSLASYLER